MHLHKTSLFAWLAKAVAICVILAASLLAQDREKVFSQKVRTFHTAAEFARLTEGKIKLIKTASLRLPDGSVLTGSEEGIVRQKAGESLRPYLAGVQLPGLEVTVLIEEQPSVIWVGTKQGLFAINQLTRAVRSYYAGKRWLPDDHIIGIGLNSTNKASIIWVETPKGFSRIEYKPMTLADKSKTFVERIRARHIRWGLTADSQLRVPGDLSTNQMVSSDNNGLWTAM